jgi:uncharacterized coiled-coil protein SlyX
MRDTMILRGRLFLAITIVCMLASVILPGVNAEIFDIGTKISESDQELRDRKLIYFDSGSSVYVEPDYIDYITSILDGNVSTGIDHDFGPGHSSMWFEMLFPYPINVSDIIIKPSFGGGATNYTLYINSNGIWSPWFTYENSTEETFHINCIITGIWIEFDTDGTNHYYFNDIIINYTPSPSSPIDLQNQINNITTQFDILNHRIIELNNSITEQNQTQEKIQDNLTNLSEAYNQLNQSFMNFVDEIENLDNRILQLEIKNAALENNIANNTAEIETLKSTEKEKTIEKQPDNTLVLGALVLGIIGIILALVAIMLISKKSGGKIVPPEKKDSENPIASEK